MTKDRSSRGAASAHVISLLTVGSRVSCLNNSCSRVMRRERARSLVRFVYVEKHEVLKLPSTGLAFGRVLSLDVANGRASAACWRYFCFGARLPLSLVRTSF